jgi:SAM-dependent methyltransferase
VSGVAPDDNPIAPDGNQVAPDGSPVAFYRRLPVMGEPELIHAAIPGGASVLDLGCGPGRIAGPLANLGHAVTGVDNGDGMIAALPPSVRGVVADAATVRLGRLFDVVLLVSHLVNDPVSGTSFAVTARAHLAPGGVVIGQTYPPGWDPTAGVGTVTRLGHAEIEMLSATLEGDLLVAFVRYGVDGVRWEQPFKARLLDEATLGALLAGAGLALDGWLERPGWFRAVRASGSGARD